MTLPNNARQRQSGAALIVSLIFLLLMTLLSTSSMRTSTMQERMSGNMRDWNLGFQSAEAALREAEDWLFETDVQPEFDNADGLYQVNAPSRPVWIGETPSPGNGYLTFTGEIAGVARQPNYYIEKLSSVRPAGTNTETGAPVEEFYYFRITAVGYGAARDDNDNPLASIILSTVYRSR